MITGNTKNIQLNSEEIQDIITTPPGWLLRYGIILFFSILLLVISSSAFIRYPDIVKTQLKINSANSPKPVVSKTTGKLIAILANEDQIVDSGQVLAYLESTANHEQVLSLLNNLKHIQISLFNKQKNLPVVLNMPHQLHLGELQLSYQSFYQNYLTYKASVEDGIYLKKMDFLKKDITDILRQKQFLLAQKELQQKDYVLAQDEYKMHESLYKEKVEAQAELRKQESALLAKQYPLQQTASALLLNETNYSVKEKEIAELDNQIREERWRFLQALSSLISEAEDWKSRFVLCASPSGKLSFAGAIQKDQFINANQDVFYITPGNARFMGEMTIPQYNMGKVKEGQEVLIKLKSYPYEEYGMIVGNIDYLADVPYKDSIFISRVSFDTSYRSNFKKTVALKIGMLADAEIVTEDASLLNRLIKNIVKMLK
jgi:multidrug efflux pump subunit AcrA (membrane-fusion protein)